MLGVLAGLRSGVASPLAVMNVAKVLFATALTCVLSKLPMLEQSSTKLPTTFGG